MKNIVSDKVFAFAFSFIFLICIASAAYLQLPYIAYAPVGLLIILFLIQNPQFLIYSLALSIPWSIEYNLNESLATDLPDEPLMWLASLGVLIAIATRKKIFSSKLHPVLFILFVQLLWTMITVALSADVLVSIKYFLAKGWYILAFVIAPLLFVRDQKTLNRVLLLLLVSTMAIMFISLVRHAAYNFSFGDVNNSLAPFFRNHVNYSALLVCMVPILISFIKLSFSQRVRNLFITLLFISIVALYFSFARGAWVALIVGLLAFWLIKKRMLFFSFLFIIFLSFVGILWLSKEERYLRFAHDYKTTIFHKDFKEHLVATYTLKDVSSAERFNRWIAGVRMAKDSWMHGFGPNTFYDNYKPYTVPAFKTWVSRNAERSTVHNYFLLLLIEQGALGLILFIVLLGALFWYAQTIYHRTNDIYWKSTVAATASILTMICTVNFLSDLIESDKVGSIFYLCVAVLIITDFRTRIKNMDG